MTLGEVYRALRAADWGERRAIRIGVSLAWTEVALSRSKRLQPLERLLNKLEPKKPLTEADKAQYRHEFSVLAANLERRLRERRERKQPVAGG